MKNKTIVIVVFVIIIFLGVLVYLGQTTPQPSSVVQQNQPQTQALEAPKVYTYPKGYPEELAFDLSRIESISETKDANGNNVVIIQFTSKISLANFPSFAKQTLELKKWVITQDKTEGVSQIVVATRRKETVTVNMSQSDNGTTVKVNYQQ